MIFTFRTNPFKEKLQSKYGKVFVFGSLKKDLETFSAEVLKNKPQYIIGIAHSNFSRFESKAINRFNRTKKINKKGKDEISLFIPQNNSFKASTNTIDSFCNWTAYKIAQLIEENKLDTKIMFVHLGEKDLDALYEMDLEGIEPPSSACPKKILEAEILSR